MKVLPTNMEVVNPPVKKFFFLKRVKQTHDMKPAVSGAGRLYF